MQIKALKINVKSLNASYKQIDKELLTCRNN